MEKTTLIFDYDGTLHNTLSIYEPAFREAYNWLINEGVVKYEPVSSERVAGWLGINPVDMWNEFQPSLSEEYKKQASDIIGKLMVEKIRAHEAVWYPGTEQTLDRLKSRYRMVVLSNCTTEYSRVNWDEFHMDRWFDRFYDCESYGFVPKTEIVKDIMEAYPGNYAVVGDRKKDRECAEACDGLFVGCLYGFGSEEELEGNTDGNPAKNSDGKPEVKPEVKTILIRSIDELVGVMEQQSALQAV